MQSNELAFIDQNIQAPRSEALLLRHIMEQAEHDEDTREDLLGRLRPSDFTVPLHQRLFAAITHLARRKTGPTIECLSRELCGATVRAGETHRAFLELLAERVPRGDDHIEDHVRNVLDLAGHRRNLREVAARVAAASPLGLPDLQRPRLSLDWPEGGRAAASCRGDGHEIPTGLLDLDAATGGLHRGRLTLVTGSTRTLATHFAYNLLARLVISERVPALLVETSFVGTDPYDVLVAYRAGCNLDRVRRAPRSQLEDELLCAAHQAVGKAPWARRDHQKEWLPGSCPKDIPALGPIAPHVIIVDSLSDLCLPDCDDRDPKVPPMFRVQEAGSYLASIAREHDVAILAVLWEDDDPTARYLEEHAEGLLAAGPLSVDADQVLAVRFEEAVGEGDQDSSADDVWRGEFTVVRAGTPAPVTMPLDYEPRSAAFWTSADLPR